MFETSQQEPSGGSTKTVGLVIGIGVVVLVAFYFMFMRRESGAFQEPNNNAAASTTSTGCGGAVDPDAKFDQDLKIGNHTLGRDQTQTMAVWSIQVTNRSRTACYNNIRYATNYYDGSGNVIYHNEAALPGEVAQGDQQTFSGINDGLYPLATTNYTIEIKSAEAHKP